MSNPRPNAADPFAEYRKRWQETEPSPEATEDPFAEYRARWGSDEVAPEPEGPTLLDRAESVAGGLGAIGRGVAGAAGQAYRGAGDMFGAMGVGLLRAGGGALDRVGMSEDNLLAQAADALAGAYREFQEETKPETGAEMAGRMIGRMGAEGVKYVAGGGAIRAGLGAAAKAGSTVAPRAADLLARLVAPSTRSTAIGRGLTNAAKDVAVMFPIDAITVAAGPEESTIGALGQLAAMSESPRAQAFSEWAGGVAENPATRVLSESLIGGVADVGVRGLIGTGRSLGGLMDPAGIARGGLDEAITEGVMGGAASSRRASELAAAVSGAPEPPKAPVRAAETPGAPATPRAEPADPKVAAAAQREAESFRDALPDSPDETGVPLRESLWDSAINNAEDMVSEGALVRDTPEYWGTVRATMETLAPKTPDPVPEVPAAAAAPEPEVQPTPVRTPEVNPADAAAQAKAQREARKARRKEVREGPPGMLRPEAPVQQAQSLSRNVRLVGHADGLEGRRAIYEVGGKHYSVSEPVALDVDGVPMGLRDAPYAFDAAARGDAEQAAKINFTPAQEAPAPTDWRTREVKAAEGLETEVSFPGDETELPARYALMEADDLRASNDPHTGFDRRPEDQFPAAIQGRAYHGDAGKVARERVVERAGKLSPTKLLDTSLSAANGPPTVNRQGVVIAGNDRTMATQLASRKGGTSAKKYRDTLRARAAQFGLDPSQVDGFTNPVLVRVVDETDVDRLAHLNRQSDVPEGKALDPLSQGKSMADALSTDQASEALEHFTQTIGDATIRDYLSTADGRVFMRRLVEAGVIPSSQQGAFMTAGGVPTPVGRTVIENMMLLAAFKDADFVGRAPASVLRKLESSIPAIIRAARSPAHDVTDALRDAMDLISAARENGMPLEGILAQGDITGRTWDPEVVELATLLDSAPKSQVTRTFRELAADADNVAWNAAEAERGPDMFGEVAQRDILSSSPEDARRVLREGLAPIRADAEEGAVAIGLTQEMVRDVETVLGRLPEGVTFDGKTLTGPREAVKKVVDDLALKVEDRAAWKIGEGVKRGRARSILERMKVGMEPPKKPRGGDVAEKINSGQAGFTIGAVLGRTAVTGIGATTGAAVDEDNPLRGALIGAAAINAPAAIKAFGATPMGQTAVTKLFDDTSYLYRTFGKVMGREGELRDAISMFRGHSGAARQRLMEEFQPVLDRWAKEQKTGQGRVTPPPMSPDRKAVRDSYNSGDLPDHMKDVSDYLVADRALELMDRGARMVQEARVLRGQAAAATNPAQATLLNNRAADLEAEADSFMNMKVPFTRAQAEQAIRELGPGVEKRAQEYRDYYLRLLEWKRHNGVITGSQFRQILAEGQRYTPFVRDVEQGIGGPPIGDRGADGRVMSGRTGIRRFMPGSDASKLKIRNPFESMILDTTEAAKRVGKQRVTNMVAAIVQANPQGAKPFLREVPRTHRSSRGRVVEANVGGKRRAYEIMDKDLYDAWASMDPYVMNDWQRILSVPKNLLRAGVTGMPDFGIANFIRDFAQMAVQYPFETGKAFAGAGLAAPIGAALDEENRLRGATLGAVMGFGGGAVAPQAVRTVAAMTDIIASNLGKPGVYDEWIRNGGSGFGWYIRNADDARRVLRDMTQSGLSRRDILVFPRVWDTIQGFNRVMEEANRVARYKWAKDHGKSIPEAIHLSRTGSLDFGRIGSQMKGYSSITAFANAKMQGYAKLHEILTNPRNVGVAMATLTAPSVALWMVNADNDAYHNQPGWMKNMFWLVPKPGNPSEFYKIPKPFELGFIFASLPERLLDAAFTDKGSRSQVRDAFFEMAAQFGELPVPTAALPIVENLTDHSFFRNRPINPHQYQNLPDHMQYDERTTTPALMLGRLAERIGGDGVSPAKIDNLIRGWTGTAGAEVANILTDVAREVGLDTRSVPPQKTGLWNATGGRFVRRFSTEEDVGIGEAEHRFRKEWDEVEKARNELMVLMRQGDTARLQARRDEIAPLVARYGYMNEISNALNEIRGYRRQIVDDRTMTADQKREALKKINRAASDLVSMATAGIEEAVP